MVSLLTPMSTRLVDFICTKLFNMVFQEQQILNSKYQLQEQLGRTAAGHQTWLAKDLTSNESVAIKLLAFNPQMRWEELKLFEREAQTGSGSQRDSVAQRPPAVVEHGSRYGRAHPAAGTLVLSPTQNH